MKTKKKTKWTNTLAQSLPLTVNSYTTVILEIGGSSLYFPKAENGLQVINLGDIIVALQELDMCQL
jgi:hypothetical protein